MGTMNFFRQRMGVSENGADKVHLEKNANYIKMTIDDDIALQDYSMAIKMSGNELNTFVFAVFWNDEKQAVNSGTYYNFNHNDRKYNVAVTKEKILIDERTPLQKGMCEKRLTMYEKRGEYDFFKCRHDEMASTHDMEYFTSREEEFLASEMTNEDFDKDVQSIFSNLDNLTTVQGVDDICRVVGKVRNCIAPTLEIND